MGHMKCYDVICRGEILPGHDPEIVKQELASLFKLAPDTLERLLSGQSATVKRNTDRQTAEKYHRTAKKCGILFHILPASTKKSGVENTRQAGTTASPVPTARSMSCPHCGFEQAISNTCIQCGAFVFKTQRRSAGTAPLPRTKAMPPSEPRRTKPPKNLFRKARIAILAAILIIVGLSSWLKHLHATGWKTPLTVAIYPINADGSDRAAAYIEALAEAAFDPLESYFAEEAQGYGLGLTQPFTFVVAAEIDERPPDPPKEKRLFNVIWWSLKLRHWAHSSSWQEGLSPDIKLFVLYYDTDGNDVLDDSLGLEKAMIGIVHAYAADSFSDKNSVIIAHEILHTVGATDKYDLNSHQPIYPDGYAEPDLKPRHPQELAEIMASRIPLTPATSKMPPDLNHTLIGPLTAQEINWIH
jgi:hypothetical protein